MQIFFPCKSRELLRFYMSIPSEYKGNHFPTHFLCSLLCCMVNIPAKNKAAQLRAIPLGTAIRRSSQSYPYQNQHIQSTV